MFGVNVQYLKERANCTPTKEDFRLAESSEKAKSEFTLDCLSMVNGEAIYNTKAADFLSADFLSLINHNSNIPSSKEFGSSGFKTANKVIMQLVSSSCRKVTAR